MTETMMSTLTMTAPDTTLDPIASIETGDVLEVGPLDDPVTVLVLLASDTEVILDRLDESMPLVVRRDWLANARRFDPAS